ncbi:hypothetical protein PG996_008323 [Apiospora saccharicola]|uniref:Uncharacterized protein n=1 Tax=Apiospora saccharicola TaxID=335842 RepID=A0ABR1UXK7_9PEZI
MKSSLFKSSNGEPGTVVHLPGKGLSIGGLCADTISFVGSAFEPVDRAPNQVREILADWSAVCRRTLSKSDDPIVQQTLSRIMCASIGFGGTPYDAFHGGWRRLREGDLPSAAEWQHFTDGNMWTLPEVYRGTMETISSGRCLFATEGGRLGLCYKTVQPGDQVWAVRGSNLPFVLRYFNRGDELCNSYRFMGDCTLDGMMDGETCQTNKQWRLLTIE